VPRNTVKTLELISRYAEDIDIVRPEDFSSQINRVNSVNKLYIIQNIDRKLSLDDIASAKDKYGCFVERNGADCLTGTKLNIKYWVDEMLDEDQQEEIQ
jgi:ATP-dependent DNA helicase RecQ